MRALAFACLAVACDSGGPAQQKIVPPPAPPPAPTSVRDASIVVNVPNRTELYGRVDVTKAWQRAVKLAIKQRTEPKLVFPPRGTIRLGRCALALEPLAPADQARARAAFVQRYGDALEIASNELTGYVLFANRFAQSPYAPELTQDALITRAAVELVRNVDLFGLEDDDLATASATIHREGPVQFDPHDRFSIEVANKRPEIGFENFRSMDRSTVASVNLRSDGKVTLIAERIDQGRGIDICATPKITAVEANRRLVGQDIRSCTLTGSRSVGKVSLADIDSTTLTIYRYNNRNPDQVRFRLAYEITVRRWFHFIVDADDGSLIRSYYDFVC